MVHFLPFFLILFAGLLFSATFKRVQVPWVVALILGGIIIGPNGLELFQIDSTIEFMSQTGLILLAFMAGLESQFSGFKEFKNKMYVLALINGFIPFVVGVVITHLLGYSFITSLLMGVIFIASSVAVVIPSLESTKLINTPLGSSVLSTSVVQDIASLVLLSIVLQSQRSITNIPLYIFYPLVFGAIISIRLLLPKIQKFISDRTVGEDDIFQRDLRMVLLILFGVVIIFELLGLHAIIAGFFTGLVLSDSLKSEVLLGKIRAISYGVFIPTFFIVVGIKTEILQIFEASEFALLTAVVVFGSIISKLLSGSLGARIVGFNKSQSLFFGVSSIPQLSTTLAAAFTGLQFGLLTPELTTAIVVLSVVSTILGPLLMSSMNKYVLSTEDIIEPHQ